MRKTTDEKRLKLAEQIKFKKGKEDVNLFFYCLLKNIVKKMFTNKKHQFEYLKTKAPSF